MLVQALAFEVDQRLSQVQVGMLLPHSSAGTGPGQGSPKGPTSVRKHKVDQRLIQFNSAV